MNIVVRPSWVLGPAIALLSGCLQIDVVDTLVDPSSAVVVTLEARGSGGSPLPDLEAEDFDVLEDGDLISQGETDQALIDDEALFLPLSLVLIDLSSSVLEGNTLSHVQDGVRQYAATVMGEANPSGLQMAVYTFDGSAELRQIVDFTADYDLLQAGIDQLTSTCEQEPCDPSSNLHGAITQGLDTLDAAACAADRMGIASLVLFTDGPDQAARVDKSEVMQRRRDTTHQVYVIGLGDVVEKSFMRRVATHGTAFPSDAEGLADAWTGIGDTVAGMFQSTYALVYCSPKRSGLHDVRVRARRAGSAGAAGFEIDAGTFDAPPTCVPEDWLDGSQVAPLLAGARCDASSQNGD